MIESTSGRNRPAQPGKVVGMKWDTSKCPWKGADGTCGTVDCVEHGSSDCPEWPFHDVPCDQPCDVAREAVRKTIELTEDRSQRKTCPTLLAGIFANCQGTVEYERVTEVDAFCRQDTCQMWEAAAEPAGGEDACSKSRAVGGPCSDTCYRQVRIRHKGRCALGGDSVVVCYTHEPGSPECGVWEGGV